VNDLDLRDYRCSFCDCPRHNVRTCSELHSILAQMHALSDRLEALPEYNRREVAWSAASIRLSSLLSASLEITGLAH
jgi:hypothetical protein